MLPWLLALGSAALFGAATPASKSLLGDVPPFLQAGLLYLGAAAGVSPFLLVRRGGIVPRGLDRRNALRLTGAVLLGGGAGPVLLLLGLRLASASAVSLWLNLEMVATVALGHLLFRDRLGGRGWIAAAGIVAASALLSAGEPAGGGWGALLVAGACVCWGFDNHLTALLDRVSPAQTVAVKGVFAGGVNVAIGLALAGVPAPRAAACVLAVGALSYGASMVLYIEAARLLGATRAQLVFSSAPFFGAALSIALLGEPLTAPLVASGGILAGSLLLLAASRHAHGHVHEPVVHEHGHRHDDGHHDHEHPGLPASTWHAHEHAHARREHAHAHWPDLHHRHPHPRGVS